MNPTDIPGLDAGQIARELDAQDIEQLMAQIDPEDVQELLGEVYQAMIVPHLTEVRADVHAEDTPDPETVRQALLDADPERRQEVFQAAVDDVIAVLLALREDPEQAMHDLKDILRDPWTTEGLLLIFQNDDHIDPEYTAEMMEYVGGLMRLAGVALLPELYTEAERQAVAEELGIDPNR